MALLAAPRDASWFNTPGRAGPWHVATGDGMMRCSPHRPLVMEAARPAGEVEAVLRCRRAGCRRSWPALPRAVARVAELDPRVRQLVQERDGWRCRRCGRGVVGVVRDVHHRWLRSQGGPDEPWNLVLLCRACHDLVHGDRPVGRSEGFILAKGSDGASIPYLDAVLGWVLLGGEYEVNLYRP